MQSERATEQHPDYMRYKIEFSFAVLSLIATALWAVEKEQAGQDAQQCSEPHFIAGGVSDAGEVQ